MTAKDIITIPNPLLHERSQRVGHVDAEIEELAASMIKAAVDWENGREHEFSAALAAVQVAQPYRVVVASYSYCY